jgi:integration host factor subunit beta
MVSLRNQLDLDRNWIRKFSLTFQEDTMNKADLILALKKEAGLTKPEADAVVNLFFNAMANALAAGDRVEIRGLCSFFVKEYKAYTGRNPKTGETTKVKPKKLPFFKCAKELKERVNG